jgi:5-oxopent-3-ene-1,2,5-tricarboxylate decarboxylase/2-hydroxyhepta-2,4-diene-1,7-dioate isomerase
MTRSDTACACHDDLGITRTAVSDDVIAVLRGVSIPSISGILRRLGYPNTFLSGLVPRTSAQGFVGRAFTARTVPTRKDVAATQARAASLHRRAFETIAPGDVLVIDARGDVRARVTGDILATRFRYRGAAALVTDGAIGDLGAMQAVGLPLYSLGLTPVTSASCTSWRT